LFQLAFPDVETTAVNTQFAGQSANVISQFHSPDSPLSKFQGIPFLLAHLTLSIPMESVEFYTVSLLGRSAAFAASNSPTAVRMEYQKSRVSY
jgi:hypothetical protein